MAGMRPWAAVLAAVAASAPLSVIGILVVLPFFLGTSMPSPLVAALLAVGVFGVVTLIRAACKHRLTTSEQAIVNFWSLAPPLVVPIASAIGALPLLVLHAVGITLGPIALRFSIALLLVFASLVLWRIWLSYRASLSGEPGSGAA
jgi:hypothetical protein